MTLTNGLTGEGYASVSPDDFGTFGFDIGQQFDDEYYPPGVPNPFTPTYISGPMLFVTTPGNVSSQILLTGYKVWADFVENPPPTPDGLAGMHTQLTRTVMSGITLTGTKATSTFRIADVPSGMQLDWSLLQELTSDATNKTAQVDQIYTVKNNGSVPVDIVFHLAWEADLYYNQSNKWTDDIVGTDAGHCGAYMHDGDPRWSLAIGNGPSSTVPLAGFYAGKQGVVPGAGPAFEPISAAIGSQWLWIDHGMPAPWQNYVVGPGYTGAGESDPTLLADATLGSEYRFTLAVGDSQILHVRRYYGITTIPCFTPGSNPTNTQCGNGVVETGEPCDGADTPTCNGATCTISMCGDGYMNAAAGEACDEGGDTASCTANCTLSACGDGYVNAVAGEECETGALCDTTTCMFSYSVGGGCAGCRAGDGASAGWLLVCGVFIARRRRRARRR